MTVSAIALNRSGSSAVAKRMLAVLEKQRAAQLSDGPPSARTRVERIDRLIVALIEHEQEIVDALDRDFGHRSHDASRYIDVAAIIEGLRFAKKHVAKWMRPERRSPVFPLGLLGAKARVEYQPLGVVGIVSPWNFPVNLAFAPLTGVLAAGNRAMLKPSEVAAASADVIAKIVEKAFDESEVAVVTGGPDVGEAFTRLAFDHLVFTGGTAIARHVMRAAADNLVPLTLELGGKCPVIIGANADLRDVALKTMNGKCLNAGQICLAPDYVLVPEARRDELVSGLKLAVADMYDGLRDNPDYTSVVNERHYGRLQGYLDDARAKGAELVELNPRNESFAGQPAHKMAPTLVLNPTGEMKVMQEEIFGPVLPIKTYRAIDDAIAHVNAGPRPLALYYFGPDQAERERVLARTTSGGVSVNDVGMHALQEDLPFGGVGPSGMGAYRGRDGFCSFSHRRAVFTQAKLDFGKLLRPPYGEGFRRIVRSMIKR